MSSPLIITWTFLSTATLLSWWLEASIEGAWVGSAILLIAFFKARLILMVFMGVRDAPPAIRQSCEVWVVIACTAVMATYWLAPFY